MNFSSSFIKTAMLIGAAATTIFAGVEPSPFLPIWKLIIIIIGG